MAANLATHLPIIDVGTISGNQPLIRNMLEGASQTYQYGSVVELSAGYIIIWDDATIVRGIYGVSMLPGFNLSSAGKGASPLYGNIGFPGGTPTFGSVINEPSAVNLVHGAVFTTGLAIVLLATADTLFEAMTDASSGGTYNPTNALIGTQCGLTVDGNGYWYVDLAKTTVGTNTVVTVQSINPQDLVVGSTTTGINNARVRFTFNQGASQVQG